MSKIRNQRARRNIVLIVLSFVYVFLIGLIDDSMTRNYLYYFASAAIYFSAVLVISEKEYKYFFFAVTVILLDAVSLFFDFELMSIIASVISFAFFIFVIVKLVIRIAKSKTVGALEFIEAVNIYFLFGIVGSILFRLIYTNDVHSFNYPSESLRHTADFLYFSFVTISTLGYGDITPNQDLAKSLSIFLSVTGQLYLTMIIAMLVGKYLSQPKHDKKVDEDK